MNKIFCIGHATYDITLPVNKYPKENTKVKTYKKIECGGGSAANAAVLLSQWGEKTFYIGAVGGDYYGKRIIGAFKYHDVNVKYVSIVKTSFTSTSFIVASTENGKRTITTFKDKTLKCTKKVFTEEPNYIFLDGEHLDQSLAIIGKSPNAVKVLDAGSVKESTLSLCPLVDYIVCSKDFAEEFTNVKINSKDIESVRKAHRIIEKKFNTNVIITLEEHGSFSKIDKKYKIVPSIKVVAVDSTGAGDIYHGAFVYFLAQGYDLERVMRLSNIAGALSVTKFGGRFAIPTLENVMRYE